MLFTPPRTNHQLLTTPLLPPLSMQRKKGVVWNRTPRGEGFAQVEENFVSESEYSDEYESEEYDTDGYSDEDEEEALTDDDAASAYTQFLLYGYGYHHGR